MKEISGNLIGKGLKVAVVVSRFNDLLTKELLAGAVDCLTRHGVADDDITVAWVPGANEAPQAAKWLADGKRCQAVVVLGAVIQGATPHAGLINAQVSRSLAQIALESGVPVINGIVCADTLDQALERSGTKAGNKGWTAGQAAIEMANLVRQIKG